MLRLRRLSPGASRVGGAAVALALAGLGWMEPRAARAESPLELAVKATYLYKLAPFVEWPPNAYSDPAAPLVLCVQGDDAFSALVERAVAGQKVGAHAIEVRRSSRLEPQTGCHIAFVGGSAAQTAGAALQALHGAPVLTVTDEAKAAARGVVNFHRDQGKVRFDIDKVEADQARLVVSSKLLNLALHVRTR